jgi:hypothetical protein
MPNSRSPVRNKRQQRPPTGAVKTHRADKSPSPHQQQTGLAVLVQQAKLDSSSLSSTEMLQLQQTYGNKRVSRLIAGKKPALVRRQLDDTKYAPEALAAAGISPGVKLFGKTAFGKVKVALEAYYKATTQTEQYKNLNKILAASQTYEQSSTREKSHKGKKKVREDPKSALIADLILDSQAELENLKDAPDPELLQQYIGDDPETAVMVVSNKIAQVIGISLDQLKAMSPADLKIEFIENVYLEYSMKKKNLEDTGEKGKLIEQIDQALSTNVIDPVDAARLPEGDAKDLYDKIKASQIDNPTAYRSSKAPKFMRGGSVDEKYQPEIEDWSAKNEMKISGNDDFREKIKGLIDTINTVPVGQALLKGLGSAPDVGEDMIHDEAKSTVVSISPPSISSATRVDAETGAHMYSASAGGSSVVVDPDNPFVGSDISKGDTEPWRIRDAAIGLFHELIHTYLHKIGGEEFSSKENEDHKLKIGSQGGLSEVRITGVPYEENKDGGTYTYPFDDPKYNYISENTFRREFAASKEKAEVYLRPSYGNQPGQKPLGLGPTKLEE